MFGTSIFFIEIDNCVTEFVKSNKQSAKYDWCLMIIIQISFNTELGYWFYTDTVHVHISKIVWIVTLITVIDTHADISLLFTILICRSVISRCRESIVCIKPQESYLFIGTDDIDSYLPIWLDRKDKIRKEERSMI